MSLFHRDTALDLGKYLNGIAAAYTADEATKREIVDITIASACDNPKELYGEPDRAMRRLVHRTAQAVLIIPQAVLHVSPERGINA